MTKIFETRPSLLLGVAFLFFLGYLLPLTQNYPYYPDDYIVFKRAHEISSNPFQAWAPVPRYDRRHPLFFYTLFLEKSVFGFHSTGYFFILFLFHFFNSLLVVRLCQSLGGKGFAPFLSGLFFLFSSTSYQNLIFIQASIRVFCIFWFLLATTSWVKFLLRPNVSQLLKTIAFQTAALLTMEDACVFPLIAALLAWRILPAGNERAKILFRWVPVLFLVDLAVLLPLLQSFFFSSLVTKKFSTVFDLPEKLASLVKMFLQPLIVPEKDFLLALFPKTISRLAPAFLIFVFIVIFYRRKERIKYFTRQIPRQLIFTSLVWIAVALSPFLFQPLTFEHASRYLYLPMVGFNLILAGGINAAIETVRTFVARKGLIFLGATIAYILMLNLASIGHHYERYRKDAEGNPDPNEVRAYERVSRVFETGKA